MFSAAPDSTLNAQVEMLYTAHHGWLQGWLRRKLGDAFLAADLSHDTFVRILAKDVPPEWSEPRALLTTIANGLVMNWHRHQRIEKAYLDELARLPEQMAPSPEARALVIEALVELDRLLAELPGKVRQAFLLSQLEGMRQSEIAATLGVSVPTVKRYVARALEHCCFGMSA